MSPARTAFAWTVFPLGLGTSIAALIALMQRGVAPELAMFGTILTTYAVVLSLERFLPLHESWKHSFGDVHVDIGHAIVSGGITTALLRPLMLAFTVMVRLGSFTTGSTNSTTPLNSRSLMAATRSVNF